MHWMKKLLCFNAVILYSIPHSRTLFLLSFSLKNLHFQTKISKLKEIKEIIILHCHIAVCSLVEKKGCLEDTVNSQQFNVYLIFFIQTSNDGL